MPQSLGEVSATTGQLALVATLGQRGTMPALVGLGRWRTARARERRAAG